MYIYTYLSLYIYIYIYIYIYVYMTAWPRFSALQRCTRRGAPGVCKCC